MPATVIVGLQWGDEGKGKTTDFLAEQTAMVVRYQGGDNAGHTVVVGDETVKLQLCPSGVLYPHITSVIGNGVVVNPATLIRELDMLAAKGVDVSKVRVSRSAHVIMPYHVALDKGNESRLAGAKVGTTGRGIGPTYGDRAWRLGLRMEDLCDEPVLRERITRALVDKNLLLANMGVDTFEVEPLVQQGLAWGERLRPHLDDSTWLVQDALAAWRPRAARGCPGHAAGPRSRQLPVRHQLQPRGRRCLHRRRHRAAPGRRDHWGDEGLRDPRRVRPVPHGAGRRGWPRDRGPGPRVRHRHRTAPPGGLVRHRPAALRGRGQLELRDRAQQARHPVGDRDDQAVRGL